MRFLNRSAGRLSRHRRRPVAGLLLLLLGPGADRRPLRRVRARPGRPAQSDEELVAEGRKLFLVGCSFCHGQNGEGVSTIDGNQFGPSLAGVGAAAVDFQVGTGRMPMAQPGAQNPHQAAGLHRGRDRRARGVRRHPGPGPAVPDPADYSLAGLSDEEREEAVARGGQIFLTNCTACHNFAGKGGAMPRGGYAPDLSDTSAAAHLRGAAHRPRPDGHLLQRQPLAGGEARRHRLPLLAARAARTTAASTSAAWAR